MIRSPSFSKAPSNSHGGRTKPSIPIAFKVETILDVYVDQRDGRFRLSDRPVKTAYLKDYDAITDNPAQWPLRFDTSQWGLMIARIDGQCIAGAAVAYDTPGLDMLEGRSDLAVLWGHTGSSCESSAGRRSGALRGSRGLGVGEGLSAAEG